jgi:hypothetical protein
VRTISAHRLPESPVLAAISPWLTQSAGISLKYSLSEKSEAARAHGGYTNRSRMRRLSLPKVSDLKSELPGHNAQCFGAEPYLEAIS